MINHKMQKDLLRSYLQGTLEECDKDTWEHSVRVGKLCQLMAQELNFSRPEISFITLAGLLHDIGKVFMPDIINQPGILAPKQRDIVGYHPQFGSRFVNIHGTALPETVTEGIILHHERLNGKGYPFKLQGTDIPLVARIVAVADVFDAMSHPRPYRPALTRREIITELDNPGYDYRIVMALMKNI